MNAHNSKLSQYIDTTLNSESILVTDFIRVLFLESVRSTSQSLSYSNRYCLVKKHMGVKFISTLYIQADLIQAIQSLREIIQGKQYQSTSVFMNRYSLVHSRVFSVSDIHKFRHLKSSLRKFLSLSKHWPLEINSFSIMGRLISDFQPLLKLVAEKNSYPDFHEKFSSFLECIINVSSSLVMIKEYHTFISSNSDESLIKNNHFKALLVKLSTKKSKRITTLNQVNKLMQNFSQAIALDKLLMMRQAIQSYITKYGTVKNPILWMSSHDSLLSIKNCDKLLVKISQLNEKQLGSAHVQKLISQMSVLMNNALKSDDINMLKIIKKAKDILNNS